MLALAHITTLHTHTVTRILFSDMAQESSISTVTEYMENFIDRCK